MTRFVIYVKIVRTFLNECTFLRAATSVGNIIFRSAQEVWQKTYNIDCERCNAPSPFVVAVHFHYCALKRAETENSKNSILSYWCISCLSEIWKAYICADTNFIFYYPPPRASKNSLSQITTAKCTVYRIPITQHAAYEFLSPSM